MFPPERVTIIHGDFMEVSLAALAAEHGRKLRLAGNLPYHLTSSILFKTFDEHAALRDITIMVQREVAKRITARISTKDYGILAVSGPGLRHPKILFYGFAELFFSRPEVESAIVNFALHGRFPSDIDEKIFTLLVKTTFGKRRKTLRNSLEFLPFDEDAMARILQENEPLPHRAAQNS